MDFVQIIKQLAGSLWYFLPIAIFIGTVKSSWFKGVIGELVVNVSLKSGLDKDKYHLFKNVTLPTEGGSTQIDHIIVSEFGVFVIETKNIKGWIFGSAKQKTWTQKIYRYTNQFQNPLHQNYKHVKTLSALLELGEDKLHSVIVFVGDSTFKTKMPVNVTYGGGCARYIKLKKAKVLSELQVAKIIDQIEDGRLTPSFKTNREHVRHVRSIVTAKDNNHKPSCPKCGASMVLRVGKRGQHYGNKFWGCSQFPQCRGVKKV